MIDRIKEMEERLNRLIAVVENENVTKAMLDSVKDDADVLSEYMTTVWIDDYFADESGLVPKDLPRGVLSQDLLYDAVCRFERLISVLSEE